MSNSSVIRLFVSLGATNTTLVSMVIIHQILLVLQHIDITIELFILLGATDIILVGTLNICIISSFTTYRYCY